MSKPYRVIVERDYQLPAGYGLKRGTVAMMTSRSSAMRNGEPFFVLEGHWYMIPGDPVPPGYYDTVNVMLGMIPATCEAPPGILQQPSIGSHYTADGPVAATS